MTRKLYYEDSHIKAFEAVVTAVLPADGIATDGAAQLVVELDRTAFFPEAGGQTADTGVLRLVETADGMVSRNAPACFRVVDVQEDGDRLLHYLEAESGPDAGLATGDRVECELDWDVRFAKMQNHTAEHILSGLVHAKYGYENVGFHVSIARKACDEAGGDGAKACSGNENAGCGEPTGEVTFDFNGELTAEQLAEVEGEANAVVWAAKRVTTSFPAPEELPDLFYRSKLELTENVRLVTIEDTDVCACCAPHVANTAEIGPVKILWTERYKGGVRIHMKAGILALNDYAERIALTTAVSQFLSCPAEEIPAGLEKLKAADDLAHEKRVALEKALADARALFLCASAVAGRPVVLFESLLGEDAVRRIVNETVSAVGGAPEDGETATSGNGEAELSGGVSMVAVFFAPNETKTAWRYVIGSAMRDLRPFAKELNAALNGRGGGRPEMIQGSVSADQDAIEQFFFQ